MSPQPFDIFPATAAQNLRGILSDIDDTLTTHGKLLPCALKALAKAKESGLLVVIVTGRPAGWVDHIARMWPVDGVIGENGAFYFHMHEGKLKRRFLQSPKMRATNRRKLNRISREVLKKVRGTALASDQEYRACDLAIDYCEDVKPLDKQAVARIVSIFENHGATAKVSSIHVNGWFGRYDKLQMTQRFLAEVHGLDLAREQSQFLFFGDSPNDEPLFEFFDHGVGVANVRRFLPDMKHVPTWITPHEASRGVAEAIETILKHPYLEEKPMAELIEKFTQVPAAGDPPKIIREYIGRVNSKTQEVSIAHMQSPAGWQEPGQRPAFDEYTVVLKGLLLVELEGGKTVRVAGGQAVHTKKGEWVRYSSPEPGGAEYIAVCLPAFSIETVNRD